MDIQDKKYLAHFDEFIDHLKRLGFTITIDHYAKFHVILDRFAQKQTFNELKKALCSIFATGIDQQEQFYIAFDSFFPPHKQITKITETEDKKRLQTDKPTKAHEKKHRKWPYWLSGIFLFILSIGFVFYIENLPQTEEQTVKASKPTAKDATISDEVINTSAVNQEVQPDQKPTDSQKDNSFYKANKRILKYGFLFAIAFIVLFVELYRYNQQKMVLQRQKGKKPPFTWPIRVQNQPLSILKTKQFYSSARHLRNRLQSDVFKLDISATISSTIEQSGFLIPQYIPITRPPEYLILIDLPEYRNHFSQLASQLADGLKNEGLFVTPYYFKDDPQVCFKTINGKREYISDIQRQYRDCRLIIIGTGENLLDPITGDAESWLNIFDYWPERAILTPKPIESWDIQEHNLSNYFIVHPATLAGLSSLSILFDTGIKTDPLQMSGLLDNDQFAFENMSDINQLKKYIIDDETFQWLCACAVYPELHWNLTLYLGSKIIKKPITEKQLLNLIRLPWFQEGNIPDDLRLILIKHLNKKNEEAARNAIIDLLEKNPPPKDSYAEDTFRMNLTVQRWMLFPKDKSIRKEIQKTVLDEDRIVNDFTLLRLINSVPAFPLNFILPKRLKSLFFKHALPLFGFKAGVRLLIALSIAMCLFLLPAITDIVYLFQKVNSKKTVTSEKTIQPDPVDETIKVLKEPVLGMEFVLIPGGCFMMGSPENELKRESNEGPVHKVCLDDFWMGKYEVTVGQFASFVKDIGYKGDGENRCECKGMAKPDNFEQEDTHPVACISWNESMAFANWLSKSNNDKYSFTLPTEAQWEYSCRAGTTTPFYFGQTINTDQVNYNGNYPYGNGKKGIYRKKTTPVGNFPPNSFGLYDMHGNVWEWCMDWYGDYKQNIEKNPVGPGTGSARVVRGGAWVNFAWFCRSAFRDWDEPAWRDSVLGLRLALPRGHQAKKEE